MALPANFWRCDHLLNIFRTRPCERLLRDNVCEWRSQCQYSHSTDWPRRQPGKFRYSPELCPDLQLVRNAMGEVIRVDGTCSAGQRCGFSHCKDEVLFHPLLFKTKLCEAHRLNGGVRTTRRGQRSGGCHRFYCPFAHGEQELRPSDLHSEERDRYLLAMERLPSDDCCQVCSPHRNRSAEAVKEPSLVTPVHEESLDVNALANGMAKGMWVRLAVHGDGGMHFVPASPGPSAFADGSQVIQLRAISPVTMSPGVGMMSPPITPIQENWAIGVTGPLPQQPHQHQHQQHPLQLQQQTMLSLHQQQQQEQSPQQHHQQQHQQQQHHPQQHHPQQHIMPMQAIMVNGYYGCGGMFSPMATTPAVTSPMPVGVMTLPWTMPTQTQSGYFTSMPSIPPFPDFSHHMQPLQPQPQQPQPVDLRVLPNQQQQYEAPNQPCVEVNSNLSSSPSNPQDDFLTDKMRCEGNRNLHIIASYKGQVVDQVPGST